MTGSASPEITDSSRLEVADRPIDRRTIGTASVDVRRGVTIAGTLVRRDVVAVAGVTTEHELLARARPCPAWRRRHPHPISSLCT
jgi:hypothetical protein